MALIQCPECSREVSSQAVTCPHCGYPLQKKAPGQNADERIKQVLLNGGKIAAIKLCRELHPGLGLAEAKHYVERLVETLPEPAKQRLGGAGCVVWLVAAGTMAIWWRHVFL